MQILQLRIVLDAEYLISLVAQKVAVMFFEVTFKKLYDLAAAVALIDRIIILPEILFDLQQQDDKEIADHPVFIRGVAEVFFVYLQVQLLELPKYRRLQYLGRHRFRQQKRELFKDIMVYILF